MNMQAGAEHLKRRVESKTSIIFQGLNSPTWYTEGMEKSLATSTAFWLIQDLRRPLLSGRDETVQNRPYGIHSPKRGWVSGNGGVYPESQTSGALASIFVSWATC